MKGTFNNIATVIKTAREAHPMKFSQHELAFHLGYLNGQFISNVERALCSIPAKKVVLTAKILNIDVRLITDAMIQDYNETLKAHVAHQMEDHFPAPMPEEFVG